MSKDVEKKKNHRVGGIALGACLGALLFVGIQMHSMNHEKQSVIAQNDTFFKMDDLSAEAAEESNLLEDVASWTQDGITSIKNSEADDVAEVDQQDEDTVIEGESATGVLEAESEIIEEPEIETEQVQESEEEAVEEKTASGQANYMVLGNQNLNVRQQPSLNGAKVGTIAPGSKVVVDEQVNDWCHITGEVEGYVVACALQKIN